MSGMTMLRLMSVAGGTLGGTLLTLGANNPGLWSTVLGMGLVGWVLTWQRPPARNHGPAVVGAQIAGAALATLGRGAVVPAPRWADLLPWGAAVLLWTAALAFFEERSLVLSHRASATAGAVGLLAAVTGAMLSSGGAPQLLHDLGLVGVVVAAGALLRIDHVTGRVG